MDMDTRIPHILVVLSCVHKYVILTKYVVSSVNEFSNIPWTRVSRFFFYSRVVTKKSH